MVIGLKYIQETGKYGQIAGAVFIFDEAGKWVAGQELIKIIGKTAIKRLVFL